MVMVNSSIGRLSLEQGRFRHQRRVRVRYQEAKKTPEIAIFKRKEAKFREFAEGLRTMELPEQLRLIHSIKNSRQLGLGGGNDDE
jgi:hypothetical protein